MPSMSGHPDIQQYQVGFLLCIDKTGAFPIFCNLHGVALVFEDFLYELPDIRARHQRPEFELVT